MRILTIHGCHDASVTALENGHILGHWELERISKRKHHNDQMYPGILRVLETQILPFINWKFEEIDHVGVTWVQPMRWVKDGVLKPMRMKQSFEEMPRWYEFETELLGIRRKVFTVTHHACHAASAYYTSPYNDALYYVYDGGGDRKCSWEYGTAVGGKLNYMGDYRNNPLGIEDNVIGHLYCFMRGALPFLDLGKGSGLDAAGKFMGLSSYGEVQTQWEKPLRELFVGHTARKLYNRGSMPWFGGILPQLKLSPDMLNNPRSKVTQDFAATLQHVIEKHVISTISKLVDKLHKEHVCIGGGCGLGVQFNSQIARQITPHLYVPPCTNDSGISLGAALYMHHHVLGNPFQPKSWFNPYLGDLVYNKHLLQSSKHNVQKFAYEELYVKVAEMLMDGKIVGWAQGRAEVGPRALGNRSILCAATGNMKDVINEKVKHREWWRPFAPVILAEYCSEWFDIHHEQPYMLQSPPVQEDKRKFIPAVTHVDGTARVQTVTRQQNEKLYALLETYFKMSGIPVLLNTSFNGQKQPILNYTEDMLAMLETTAMDAVVIDNNLVLK